MFTVAPWSMRAYRALTFRLPVRGGLTRLSFNGFTNPRFARCAGPLQAFMRNGIAIEIDPHDYHGRVLYLFGTNDPKVQQTAEALLRPGDLFLDIGANHSSIGLQLASAVGPEGQIHLFEPQPELCRRVRRAIESAGLRNVTLHEVGLMDEDGELELRRPRDHTGMATFVGGRSDQRGWVVDKRPIRAVSRYLPPLLGEARFGAKIDIEGAEMRIFPWLLEQRGLRFVIFEGGPHHEQLHGMLREHGLDLYGLARRVFALRVGRVDDLLSAAAFHDFLAVRLRPGATPPRTVHPRRLAELM